MSLYRFLSRLRPRAGAMMAAQPDEPPMSSPNKHTKNDVSSEDNEADAFMRDVHDAAAEAQNTNKRARRRSSDTLADLVLKASLAPELRRRIGSKKSLCLVVEVPGADWAMPIADALRVMGRWNLVNLGEANLKNRTRENGTVTSLLSGGGRVLGVSHAADAQLPPALIGSADVRLTVVPPDESVLARVILAATGRRPKQLPPGIARSLSFSEICAAIRIDSTSAQCVDRLVAVTSARNTASSLEDVPLLHELAGYGEAMAWCTDLLADLKAWRNGTGPFPTNGRVVFAGPPGTGKTTLVRSLARTGRLNLIATSVGDWFANSPGHLDSIVKQIAEAFAAAQAVTPAVLFLDELDAMPDRATLSPRGRDWWLPVIAYLLTTLDGVVSHASRNLIIIGATNYGNRIDAALVRPGRLEQIIKIETPDDAATRIEILRTHLKHDLRDEDLLPVARITTRATGADLAGFVRRARRDARAAGRPLVLGDLMALVTPPERRSVATLRRVCVHEAGHVVVSAALGVAVRSVSVVPIGDSQGRMTVEPTNENLPVRADLERDAVISLGGMAAEEVLLGDRSLGAGGVPESDLAKATVTLTVLRTSFGLGRDLAFRAAHEDAVRLLEGDLDLRQEVEAEMRQMFKRAKEVILKHRAATEAVADALQRQRFLGSSEIEALLGYEFVQLNGTLTPNPGQSGSDTQNLKDSALSHLFELPSSA